MKITKLIKKIENLKLPEICELITQLENKYNIHTIENTPTPTTTSQQTQKLYLTECGNNKIQTIKTLKEILNIGLLEAKKISDKLPQLLLETSNKQKLNKAKAQLDAIGATTQIKT
ncbi:ribosomal protein L7/L12 [Candidatus Vidania fulgoroideae]|uniref:50S ribosomal protein L7/L12 n=1 Tax=Candidatus Vidania fulgoroideorum TaxID=881286 RepID=A0A974XDS1_9PROT|nr:ribosomal protein L7/L12 [Candidatus Vidania fulgoroideae]